MKCPLLQLLLLMSGELYTLNSLLSPVESHRSSVRELKLLIGL